MQINGVVLQISAYNVHTSADDVIHQNDFSPHVLSLQRIITHSYSRPSDDADDNDDVYEQLNTTNKNKGKPTDNINSLIWELYFHEIFIAMINSFANDTRIT